MSELINNREHRIRTLKGIIQKLHQGADHAEVRGELERIVRQTDAAEIAAMEQQLIAEGMSVEEIRGMCDLHVAVVKDVLTQDAAKGPPPGHPVDIFRRENVALGQLVGTMAQVAAEISALPDDASCPEAINRWRMMYNELQDVDKHYQRKENLLFSCLERYGITGPSQVMWAKDDEARGLLKQAGAVLTGGDQTAGGFKKMFATAGRAALDAVRGMIQKEEMILLPMALQTLTEDEWGEIWQQSPQYGWCLVEPAQGYQPPTPVQPREAFELPEGKSVMFPTGALTFEQLRGLLGSLPLDLTFVDAEDRVRYFSEGPERVFSRSKAILGRKVHHCHPPKSVDVVERILADFKAGRQNVAEFWIEHRGRFVNIRYFAVRNEKQDYIGTLEVTQDLTRLRALEGERRLLEYA